ncbi:MAG: hypothetical protein HYW25_01920 [Candidatus Aenigmarchaeota archaeon]|nr:hypothetical protein [Candidatus Aenigmarchaeota archaeon]
MVSVVVCSSFRFYPEVIKLQRRLEESGIRCEIPVPNQYLDPREPWKLKERLIEPQPEVFRAMWKSIRDHLARIGSTEVVYVFGGGEGYVGNGVSSEMGYAHGIRKFNPLQRPRTVLSSESLVDVAMRGYVEEVVSSEVLVGRLSSLHC